MNPRLYQAMDLLYMPLQDLQLHLKEQLLVNPFLELVEPEDEEAPAKAQEEERAKEEKQKDEEFDWEAIILDGFQVGGAKPAYEESEQTERVAADVRNLDDHLRDQLQLLDLTPRQRLVAEEVLGNIGPDGYLQASLEEIVQGTNAAMTRFLEARHGGEQGDEDEELAEGSEGAEIEQTEEIAEAPSPFLSPTSPSVVVLGGATPASGNPAAGTTALPPPSPLSTSTSSARVNTDPSTAPFTIAEAEAVLTIVQHLDPAGVAARNLRECLMLQLEEQDARSSLAYRLVNEGFDDLIAHRWGDLAKRFSLEPKAVQDAADLLSHLDPKPGLRFLPTDDGYVTPDLVVQKIEGQYKVFLNDGGTPRLRISKVYQDMVADKKQFQGENKEFVTEKLNGAVWLVQAIEQRRQTMLKVMNFIIDRQKDYFEKGVEFLKPLTLREVADVISMHESTVSRVTNQKYVQTPRGVLPLKFFFSSSLGTDSGEDASARAVKAQIQKMVGEEQAASPLTDAEIVEALKARGIRIARRTVAKYRDQLKILPARMRKRV
jgi:RNA polymerase sigma-54 factor